VIGLVGKLPDARQAGRLGFAAEGDLIALAGPFRPTAAGSEIVKLRGGPPEGPLPPLDSGEVTDVLAQVRLGVRSGELRSAHDIAEGGIAVALAECCIAGGIGARVVLDGDSEGLFAESPGCGFIVSGQESALAGMRIIGRVGGDALEIEGQLKLPVSELRDVRDRGLSELM
jgi:phosphoribosylformylglycinamidine synthase